MINIDVSSLPSMHVDTGVCIYDKTFGHSEADGPQINKVSLKVMSTLLMRNWSPAKEEWAHPHLSK